MRPAASVESASAARWTNTAESASTANCRPSTESTTATHRANAAISAAVSTAISITAAAIEPGPAIEAMEPRTRANKDATRKVIRPVITVWRASIGCIPIVAIRACRRCTNVPWSNSDPYSNPNLRMSGSRHNHAKPE